MCQSFRTDERSNTVLTIVIVKDRATINASIVRSKPVFEKLRERMSHSDDGVTRVTNKSSP